MLPNGTHRVVFLGAAAALFASVYLGGVAPGRLQAAATAPSLGAAASFAVLGGSTVTNTGATTIHGDLGVWPGSAVTGFPPGTVTGTIHAADAGAQQAQNAVTTAYNSLAGQACDADLTGQDLGGKTLTSGVYCFSSSAQLTGSLTLDAQGSAGAVWVFKVGSTLTTASSSSVLLINGGSPCNVFWQVGSSTTIGTTTTFTGNILALTSITVTTGADISGRALARNGAVTLDTNDISAVACAAGAATATATTVPASPTATAPTGATATPSAIPGTATAVAPTATTVPATSTATVPPSTATAAAATATGIAGTATAVAPAATTVPATTVPATPTATPVIVSPTPISPVALPNTGDGGCSDSPTSCMRAISPMSLGSVAEGWSVTPSPRS